MWTSLLEKALAKLLGSYNNLNKYNSYEFL